MKKKYNFALLPTNQGHEFIEISYRLKILADKYLLGEKSLPHITILQFYAEEDETNDIFNKLKIVSKSLLIRLDLDKLSYITFDNSTYWISLLPHYNEELQRLHREASYALALTCKENYDPHLTLINSKNPDYENVSQKIINSKIKISDTFYFALGECDEIGQFTKITSKPE